jgi:ABC-type lipoprotein release transport system permease subunit
MYKLFLCLRYLRRRYIALVAIVGMALCVFMVLVVISVFNGFLDAVQNAARGMMGDVIVDGPSGTLPRYEHLLEEIRTLPEVKAQTPVIYSYGLLRIESSYTHYVRVVGCRLPEATEVTTFGEGLWPQDLKQDPRFKPSPRELAELSERMQWARGHLDDEIRKLEAKLLEQAQAQPKSAELAEQMEATRQQLEKYRRRRQALPGLLSFDPSLPGIILGVDIPGTTVRDSATGEYTRMLPVGRKVRLTLLPIARGVTVMTEPVDKNFTFVGDSRLGIYGIDNLHVYVDFDILQELVDMNAKGGVEGEPALCSQIQIKLGTAYLGASVVDDADGVLVRQVMDGSPAAKAGLEAGDHVVAAGGRPIRSASALRILLSGGELEETTDVASRRVTLLAMHPGDVLRMTVRRQDAQHTLAARLTDPRDAVGAVQAMYALFHSHYVDTPPPDEASVQTWAEKQASYIEPIEKQRTLTAIMFSIISLVAVVLVFAIFYMMVVQRTRDVGVLKSIGGSSAGVAGIYLLYGSAIGLVGSALGAIGGCFFVRYINPIHDWVADQLHYRLFDRQAYLFDTIPNHVEPSLVVIVVLGAILAGLLGSVLPALRAARMQPVEALRYE